MKQRGFSFVELIVSLLVLTLLGAVAGYGLTGGASAFLVSAEALDTVDKLRYASERMAREVREIRRDATAPERYDIDVMTTSRLQFTRLDGTTVSFGSSPPLLTLGYSTPPGTWTLTDEVGRMAFSYFRVDGRTAATSPSDIAFVEFDLELASGGRTYPQRTRVALRNLR